MITEGMILAGAKAYDEGAFAEPQCKCAGCAESRELSQSAAMDWSRKILTAALSDQVVVEKEVQVEIGANEIHRLIKLGQKTGTAPNCYELARACLTAASPNLAPKEPTDAQVIAGLEWSLEWMRAHKVDGLSPFKDYPPVKDTIKGMYAAMIAAAPPPASPAGEGK
jgi:hypothetical protein